MIGLLRDGHSQEVRVTLRSAGDEARMGNRSDGVRQAPALLEGATLSAVPNGAGPDGTQGGVLIETLAATSPLGAARLRPGDVITEANSENVKTLQELDAIARDISAALVVRVYRVGRAFFAVVGG